MPRSIHEGGYAQMKHRGKIIAFFIVVLLFAGVMITTTSGVSKNINLGLDLQGGFEVLYEVEPVDESQEVTRTMLESTVQTLNDRVNRLGISETNIDIEGEDRIRVQLAGVEDQSDAREILATSALVSFRDVHDEEYLNGTDIKEGSAKQDFDPDNNTPMVTLQLKDADKFGDVTTKIKNMGEPDNLLVIWMDHQEGDSFEEESDKKEPKFISAPRVGQTLNTSDVQITGDFSIEEATRLADIINAGSLPVHMEELFSESVGAQFGEESLNKTAFAGIIGVSAIFLFMIFAYRFAGVIASINLAIYVYLILLVFGLLQGVLTLPGIAALILGVGMAVDANVITFERIKEELRLGKSIQSAFKAGSKNSLRTIVDANITTMLAAVVLFIFGTSSVKGFATMLIVSILMSFLTAVFGTRALLGLWVKSGYLRNKPGWFAVRKNDIRDISDTTEVQPTFLGKAFQVIKHQKKIFTCSAIILVVGLFSLGIFQLNPGIDFSSGSRIEVVSSEKISSDEVTADFDSLGIEPKTMVLSGDGDQRAVARFDTVLTEDEIAEVKEYFMDKYDLDPSVSVVSPIVGEELVKNAIKALAIAAVGMIIYVTFRFELFFGITAILTLLHDVFIVLVIFSLFNIEFDVTIVAAILTIVGYSINNTIVIFDRIRENIQEEGQITSKQTLAKVVNDSLIQSFTRSINTTVTTLLAVLSFLILGANSIGGFAVALVIGLVAGLYSSLFLASQLWLVWRGKSLKEKPLDFRKKKRVEGPQV